MNMAVKQIKEYFEQVANQYLEMQYEIKSFEEEAEKGLCDPDRVESLKECAKPIKENYMTLSYIMYLLNMPQRQSKQKAYEQRNKKLLEKIPYKNTKNGIIDENNNFLDKMRQV